MAPMKYGMDHQRTTWTDLCILDIMSYIYFMISSSTYSLDTCLNLSLASSLTLPLATFNFLNSVVLQLTQMDLLRSTTFNPYLKGPFNHEQISLADILKGRCKKILQPCSPQTPRHSPSYLSAPLASLVSLRPSFDPSAYVLWKPSSSPIPLDQ